MAAKEKPRLGHGITPPDAKETILRARERILAIGEYDLAADLRDLAEDIRAAEAEVQRRTRKARWIARRAIRLARDAINEAARRDDDYGDLRSHLSGFERIHRLYQTDFYIADRSGDYGYPEGESE